MRLIDADRLIEDMGASCLPIMEKGISEITGDESCIVDHINSAPTIDAVPVVHARWIGGKYYNDVFGYEKTCTACGEEYVVGFDYLYCPYCGAKMDGGMKDEG